MSKFSCSVPASLMLLGEHAVLHQKLAIVCAIARRIHFSLTPRSDQEIIIHSQLGEFKSKIDNISITAPFEFVTAAIGAVKTELKQGFDLEINSGFSHQLGLGSSAAITVGCVALLEYWLRGKPDAMEVFLKARRLVQSVQGLGSGADVAASVWGGTLAYCMNPLQITQLKFNPPLSVVYSGAKKPTRSVVQWLEEQRLQDPERIHALFERIHESSEKAQHFINEANWVELGKLLNENQEIMRALGLSNPLLDTLCNELNQQREIRGAKISGSGLGDCVISIGQLQSTIFPQNEEQTHLGVQQLDLTMSDQGLSYE